MTRNPDDSRSRERPDRDERVTAPSDDFEKVVGALLKVPRDDQATSDENEESEDEGR